MRLPMNITGLANSKMDLNKMDGNLFKRLGYEIARKLKGKVIDYIPPSYPLNYFRLDIKIDENTISILLHKYFPLVALASYENELQMHFLDHVHLMTELRTCYTVLETKFLNEPFNPNSHDLAEIELKSVKHWGPNINGEVIFNCWD